jgi:ATP-dependent DNA helicase RecG
MPSLKVANVVRDRDLLELAKREAATLVAASDAEGIKTELARAVGHLRSHWNRRYGLVEVG